MNAKTAGSEHAVRRLASDDLDGAIAWTDHMMAKIFAAGGFAKTPRHIIAVAVDAAHGAGLGPDDDDDDGNNEDNNERADNF